mmetsp:Transcript_48345/g.95830  ORF Transcript_48345/g.95830 Transcript_48345/m.95830 type:complete len:203 (+) Transcript_48345:484-1092(+)
MTSFTSCLNKACGRSPPLASLADSAWNFNFTSSSRSRASASLTAGNAAAAAAAWDAAVDKSSNVPTRFLNARRFPEKKVVLPSPRTSPATTSRYRARNSSLSTVPLLSASASRKATSRSLSLTPARGVAFLSSPSLFSAAFSAINSFTNFLNKVCGRSPKFASAIESSRNRRFNSFSRSFASRSASANSSSVSTGFSSDVSS